MNRLEKAQEKGGAPMTGQDLQKHFGRVYTPRSIVELMLNIAPGEDLKEIALCDPSCGDGEFLVPFVERVCAKLRRATKHQDVYYRTLQRVTGFDIDDEALKTCKKRLNEVARRYQVNPPKWKLRNIDAIMKDTWQQWAGKFDYVVGNPPYVRIQHLEASRRKQIENAGWRFMKGSCDLYLLFFDMGLELLKMQGKLIYITPNSWMKSQSATTFRKYLKDNERVCMLLDFGHHQAFPNATTYTAITAIEKGGQATPVVQSKKCTSIIDGKPTFRNGYQIDTMEKTWYALNKQERRLLNQWKSHPLKLMDVAEIRVGIQTLADDVFILPDGTIDLEPEVLRRIYKASVMKGGKDAIERVVIYPYEDGELIPEEDLARRFPKAYNWLMKNQRKLLARDKGTFAPEKWYGYGRDVSITAGFGKKILTSGMNKEPNFQYCPDVNSLFYSGYCVKPFPSVNMALLLNELNSETMKEFIRLTSRPYQGEWFSYAKSFIQNFPVSEQVVDNA